MSVEGSALNKLVIEIAATSLRQGTSLSTAVESIPIAIACCLAVLMLTKQHPEYAMAMLEELDFDTLLPEGAREATLQKTNSFVRNNPIKVAVK